MVFIALLWALCLTTIILRFCKEKWLLLIGALLFLFGIIAGPWAVTPIGINTPFNTKHGPFFSMIFFVTGWYLSLGKYIVSLKMIYTLTNEIFMNDLKVLRDHSGVECFRVVAILMVISVLLHFF
jgi:hypothetical protein